jgi:hypothetical protein
VFESCIAYRFASRAENEELDRKEAEKKERERRRKVECCLCRARFSKTIPRARCALEERRGRPCQGCVDKGISQRSVSGKEEAGEDEFVFCLQGCWDIYYGEVSDDESEVEAH